MKMPKQSLFHWEGINKHGQRIKGELFEENILAVQNQLVIRSIIPITIKKKKFWQCFLSRVKKNDIVCFTRELCILIDAGIPLANALDILIKNTNKIFRKILIAIRENLISGETLYNSLTKFSDYFDDVYINMVKAGEISGTLNIMLEQLANYLENYASIQRRVLNALYYPSFIIAFTLSITLLLLIFIIPQFENLFKSFDAKLPFFTLSVIHVSKFIISYWWLILLLVINLVIFLFYMLRKLDSFRHAVDRKILKLLFFGEFFKKLIITRITMTLSITLSAGLPLLEALELAAEVSKNNFYKRGLLEIRNEVAKGQFIHQILISKILFPTRIMQMIAVAEEANNLPIMLKKISSAYQEEIENLTNNFSKFLEPAVIILLSIIIGLFVLAMYLPIFKIGSIF